LSSVGELTDREILRSGLGVNRLIKELGKKNAAVASGPISGG